MGGFQRVTYALTFDGALEGLEVKCYGATLGEVVEMRSLLANVDDLLGTDPEQVAKRERFVSLVGNKLISWNLEDEKNEPVPCTAEQFSKEDWTMATSIARGWHLAGVTVSAPLSDDSSDGVPSEVVSTPMEILSESLPN